MNFKDKHVMLYFRPRDGIYVIPDGIIFDRGVQGGYYHTEPFEYLPLIAESEEIWEAVQKALQNTNRLVPRPKSWTEETAWYRRAGVKTWRQFAGKSKNIVSVTETHDKYVFKSHDYNRGGVTGDKNSTVKIPKHVPRDEILAALNKFLTQP
jgi:hypothetical protein